METEENSYDIAIVGGGLAGALVANRLHSSFKGSVILLDNHPTLGGKARSSSWETKQWAPHANVVSEKLYNFIANLLQSDPSLRQEETFSFKPGNLSFFIQNKMIPIKSLSQKESKIPKILGGLAAQKQWLNLWDKMFGSLQEKEQPLSKSLNISHKDALASTLKLISYTCGLSSWLSLNPKAMEERCEYLENLGTSDILKNLAALFSREASDCSLTLAFEEQVLTAQKKDSYWQIKTNKKQLKTKRLIVAHSPWEALIWLDRKDLPQKILQMALRSKPTSVVSLTKRIKKECEGLSDQMIIASESVIMIHSCGNLCFTYSLDYESSINTTEVTKAIKALRRSALKLLSAFPDLELEEESIALHPIAWGQSAQTKEASYVEKLSDYDFFKEDILFCGESYGTSYRPDENIIKSVLACASYCVENKLGE